MYPDGHVSFTQGLILWARENERRAVLLAVRGRTPTEIAQAIGCGVPGAMRLVESGSAKLRRHAEEIRELDLAA